MQYIRKFKAEQQKRAHSSRGSLHLTHSELAPAKVQKLDRFEACLLQEGTVWDDRVLSQGLREQGAEAGSPWRSPSQLSSEDSATQTELGKAIEYVYRSLAKQSELSSQAAASEPSGSQQLQQSQQPEKSGTQSESDEMCEQDNVIIFGTGTLSPWVTESESSYMDTVVPQFPEVTNADARRAILTEGMGWKPEGWRHPSIRPTVDLLSDGFLTNWSRRERKCNLHQHNFSTLNQWTQAIRRQHVQIQLPITVVAVQCSRQYECMEPLRNGIASLCRAIRSVSPGGRIFIASNVPNPWIAPVLGKRVDAHNQMMYKAVTGIKGIYSVFYCDISHHFCSDGQFIQPAKHYFTPEGDLTALGCFTYRSCLFREIGILPYHLDG